MLIRRVTDIGCRRCGWRRREFAGAVVVLALEMRGFAADRQNFGGRMERSWVLDGHDRIGVTDCSVDAQPLGQTSSS